MKQTTRFETGAVRDTQTGKPNFLECLSPFAMWRYGLYMDKASAKYGPDNWTKGIPIASYLKSLERHLQKLKMQIKFGVDLEPGVDHAGAILFNIQGLMHEQEAERMNLRRSPASAELKAFAKLWKTNVKKKGTNDKG